MEYLEKLEFNKIVERLSSYCSLDTSKNMALNLIPYTDMNEVKKHLKQTSEAVYLIQRCGMPPDIYFREEEHSIKTLEGYGVLTLEWILNFTEILKISQNLKEYFNKEYIDREEYEILEPIFSSLYTNKGIIEQVQKSIIDENTLYDNASKNLAIIRKKQKNIEQEIKQKLTNMIHSSSYSKYVQESLITIRNERYVIPIKEEYRSKIKGFVHDFSSSGSTVFIEPITIFELNNELSDLKIEENLEIEKIIKELSKLFYPCVDELKSNIYNLSKLDFIFAKAKYAKEIKANEPKINNEKLIVLNEARHPLIDEKKVVPISLELGDEYNTLVITGPNTGGKTVTLKTVGLLTCMACSGLHIPAKSSSSICVFSKIYADIGDEQSIADSLSTFSAHMKNIVNIVQNADGNTLVLVDELGSGTDPVEGEALATSILEYLYNKKSITIATTHYQELKKYAMMSKGFENASVEFDVNTLTPTYRLLIGVPGKSNAFEISKKLGLKEDIIKKSQDRIQKNDIEFEELIKQIYIDKAQIETEKLEISNKLREVKQLKENLERDNTNLLEKEKQYLENARIEARNIILEAKEEANDIIRNMEELQQNMKTSKENSDSIKKANISRNSLNNKLKELLKDNNQEETMDYKEMKLDVNTPVFIQRFGKQGIVVSNNIKNNEVIVQIDNMKINVPISDLKVIEKQEKNKNVNINTKISKTKTAKTEINVIGNNVEEASFIIEKFLDDCSLAKLETVRIIHGKGTGKLRKGIHKLLDKNPHVDSYRMGTYGEGEMGVTVVKLK